jgi:hypothetical protein
MGHPLSERLSQALSCWAGKPGDEISLDILREHAVAQFSSHRDCALELMGSDTSVIRYGTLMLHLIKTAECDSAVRDILTVGHLAKLLSRMRVLKAPGDYKIVGWPNRLFDRQSQQERLEYFERNVALPAIGLSMSSPALAVVRATEKEVLARFGITS